MSLVEGDLGAPIPGQEIVELAHRVASGHAFEDVLEIGEGLHIVELGSDDEGGDRCPALGTTIGSGKQVVLAAEGDWANGALDGVVVQFEAAVVEEAAEVVPAVQGVTDGFSETERLAIE